MFGRASLLLSCLGLFGLGPSSPAFGQPPLADPTRPAAVASGGAGPKIVQPLKWRLTSTLIASKRRVAIINDQAVQVGQAIDGAVLIAVESDSALLRRGGKKIQLDLIAETVKQTARPLH